MAHLLAGGVLQYLYGGTRTKFEDLGLGVNTVNHVGVWEGQPIHGRDAREATYSPAILPRFNRSWQLGSAEAGPRRSGMFLGNSQIHGINQYQEGQENAAEMLFNRLKPRGIEVLTFTQPSASLQEHYVLFEYLLPRLHPKFLILPVVFINQRTFDVRKNIAVCMADPDTRAASSRLTWAAASLIGSHPAMRETSAHETAALEKTTQEVAARSFSPIG